MPYDERFPIGTIVRVADRATLEEFMRSWLYHHPLTPEQLKFAGRKTRVKSVGFYHGGDVLYELESAPGTWHEACLREANDS